MGDSSGEYKQPRHAWGIGSIYKIGWNKGCEEAESAQAATPGAVDPDHSRGEIV